MHEVRLTYCSLFFNNVTFLSVIIVLYNTVLDKSSYDSTKNPLGLGNDQKWRFWKSIARNYLVLTAFHSQTFLQYITFPELSFCLKKSKGPVLLRPFCNDHVLMMTNTRVWDMFNCFLPLVRGYTPPSSTALFILYCLYIQYTCRIVYVAIRKI
jgi:hypothetical protein